MAATSECDVPDDDDLDELFALAELDDLDDFEVAEKSASTSENVCENVNVFEDTAAPVAKKDNKRETREPRHPQLKKHTSRINSAGKRKFSLDKKPKNNNDHGNKVKLCWQLINIYHYDVATPENWPER